MERRSAIAVGAVLKHFRRIVPHPWIGAKLAMLQGEKWLLDYLRPLPSDGHANKIRQISFRITDLCNLRCITCGQWGKGGFLHGRNLKELKNNEVPPDRYVQVLADLVKNGHRPLVYLWGGEPMLYDGALQLMEEATAMGLPVSIATNGSRIASCAERLVNMPLFLLQISIDGHCAEVHNRIRPALGGADNFADIQSSLASVREARSSRKKGLPLIASLTVISRENFRHLVEIYEAFRHQVDLFVFYLSWWIDDERALAHTRDFSRRFGFSPKLHWGWVADWKPDDYRELNRQMEALRARSRSWESPPVALIPEISGVENLRDYYTRHECRFGFDQCISIYQAAEIDSNGDVSPCRDYHDYVVGNIKSATLTELWNSSAYRRFRRSLGSEGLMPVCSRCCGLMGY
jgi:radical SAM protein with 4Fe4S-binding SPASM domain